MWAFIIKQPTNWCDVLSPPYLSYSSWWGRAFYPSASLWCWRAFYSFAFWLTCEGVSFFCLPFAKHPSRLAQVANNTVFVKQHFVKCFSSKIDLLGVYWLIWLLRRVEVMIWPRRMQVSSTTNSISNTESVYRETRFIRSVISSTNYFQKDQSKLSNLRPKST